MHSSQAIVSYHGNGVVFFPSSLGEVTILVTMHREHASPFASLSTFWEHVDMNSPTFWSSRSNSSYDNTLVSESDRGAGTEQKRHEHDQGRSTSDVLVFHRRERRTRWRIGSLLLQEADVWNSGHWVVW